MKECRDLTELHPKIEEMARVLIKKCKEQGLVLGIGETYRTKERQNELYAQGRSAPGNIVTYAKGDNMASYHQWRLAVDFFQNIKGREYEADFLKKVGELAEAIGFEWGGRWMMKDTCHLQVSFGLTIDDLKNGKKIPQIQPSATYLAAVEKLNRRGIISNFKLWEEPSTIKPTHIQDLIIKMACALE